MIRSRLPQLYLWNRAAARRNATSASLFPPSSETLNVSSATSVISRASSDFINMSSCVSRVASRRKAMRDATWRSRWTAAVAASTERTGPAPPGTRRDSFAGAMRADPGSERRRGGRGSRHKAPDVDVRRDHRVKEPRAPSVQRHAGDTQPVTTNIGLDKRIRGLATARGCNRVVVACACAAHRISGDICQ